MLAGWETRQLLSVRGGSDGFLSPTIERPSVGADQGEKRSRSKSAAKKKQTSFFVSLKDVLLRPLPERQAELTRCGITRQRSARRVWASLRDVFDRLEEKRKKKKKKKSTPAGLMSPAPLLSEAELGPSLL